MPSEVIVEFRGDIRTYFGNIRESIPSILTSFSEAVTEGTAENSPGGPAGEIGGALVAEPARPTEPDVWESGVISSDAELFYWHEYGTGERKESGGGKYPIRATRAHGLLVFEKEGTVHFIRGKAGEPAVVMHPGVRATRMLRNTIERLLPSYTQMFERLGLDIKIL